MLKTTLMRAALLLALLALLIPASPAVADQSTLCLPTSGTVSGLTIVTGANAALKALVTTASGDSAPANDCTAAPIKGQQWLDTSASNASWKIYDGAQWLPVGTLDASTHQWEAPVGGGATSLASTATVDLWSVPQTYITITGTTGVSKLAGSGAVVGTIKFVAFGGALTLTHNATQLILPTGANIATAAGDKMAVVALGGGNVAVLSYSRANGTALTSPVVVGDSGSGGTAGIVPAAPSGAAALNKVLAADGGFNAKGVPVGASFPCACVAAPGGYLLEYGQAVSRTAYAELWGVMHSSATVTISVASPAVVSWTGHPLSVGSPISFATTGTLPTGISAATTYYVITAGFGANSFEIAATPGGAAINTSGFPSGVHTATYAPYGAGDFATTFNLPDARGRVIAGTDNMGGTSANRLTAPSTIGSIDGDVLGNAGGQEAHTQTINELVPHTHTYTIGSQDVNGGIAADGNAAGSTPPTSSAGGGAPFNVVQPTLIMNYVIRY